MKLARQIIVWAVASVLLYGSGCAKKPSQLPQQAKTPVDTLPSNLPVEISEAPPPPPPEPKQEAPQEEQQPPKPAQHHKKKPTSPPASSQATASSPAATPATTNSGNTTIAAARPPVNPARPDAAINADVSSAELSQQKQSTAQLLEESEKAISNLNRTLSHDEEGMVNQIRSYIGQSRSATKDGDFERAYNLATKAHLLSGALAKK